MVGVEILMMLVRVDLLVEEDSKQVTNLVQEFLRQTPRREMLVVDNILVLALIEVVAEVVQVVLGNLVPVHILLMPPAVQDLPFLLHMVHQIQQLMLVVVVLVVMINKQQEDLEVLVVVVKVVIVIQVIHSQMEHLDL
jgi:hypothetical protein